MTAFNQINAKLQQASTRSDAAQVLRDNPELVSQIKNQDVKDIFTSIQSAKPTSASSASASKAFSGHTLAAN